MSAEAEFIEAPPEIETVTTNNQTSRRHNPAKMSHKSILTILRALKNEDLSLNEIENEYRAQKSKSLLNLCLQKSSKSPPITPPIAIEKVQEIQRGWPTLHQVIKRSFSL